MKRLEELQEELAGWKQKGLKLDMTRGKPCPEQLRLSEPMLRITTTRSTRGTDCRNYGNLEGLPEARELFAGYLGMPMEQIILGGNSSLQLMHDVILQALTRRVPGGLPAWAHFGQKPVFLCPVPGYDRHFSICEFYGIEMINIPMNNNGPDMDAVEEYVRIPRVVGIWCVPKYNNPTGITYSYDVVERLAAMPTKNPGFRIFWDNAYSVHHLTDTPDELADIYRACTAYNHANRVLMFGSTSKITFAGGGVSMFAASPENIEWFRTSLFVQTIGPDKLTQLRHVLFFRDQEDIKDHMARHRAILKPKFDVVGEVLAAELEGRDDVSWTNPRGGYFVSLDVPHGCAKRVVELAATAGVKLTSAGATFPGGKDPHDSNIRIAPSFPSVEEIRQAMTVLALCIKIAALEKNQ